MKNIKFSKMAERLKRSEIREVLKLTRRPDTISFGGGLPAPEIFPYDAVEAAALQAIRENGALALQYSPTEGEPFLKEQIAAYMNRQGEPIDPEELLVVSSSQQALDLLGKVFIDAGDPIITERPAYVGAIQAFRAYGADFHGIEMDDYGLIPEQLERTVVQLAAEGRKPKFVYIIPDFQNPSGINLSLERRRAVINIAARYDLLIIEDSPYRELRFTGALIPSIRSLDTEGRVIQLKTFSKVFCPGFRIGWVIAPPPILDKFVMAKQGMDLCTSAFVSMIAAYLLKDGHVEKQIEKAKAIYAKKCSIMIDALDEFMPDLDDLYWSKPDGGLFLWLRLPSYMDTFEMMREAAEAGVAYVVGVSFYPDGSGRNEMRLNFSYPSEEQIVEGIKRLADLVAKRIDVGAVAG